MNKCSGCTLCCELMPIKEVGKKAGEKCPHQIALTGCAIYANRPRSCEKWNCAWISDAEAQHLDRPDVSHYVIDPTPDSVIIHDNETGEERKISVLQIWIDPKFPDAHGDPLLRRMLEENNAPAIVRYSSSKAMILIPPSRASDGKWHEMIDADVLGEREYQQMAAKL